jgi:hypothetical protein
MKFSVVNLYSRDLQSTDTILRFPLLGGTPTAVASFGSGFVLAEVRCQGSECLSQLVRHDSNGWRTELGPPLARISAIRPDARGGLLVAAGNEIVRVEPPGWTVTSRVDVGEPPADFDVDSDRRTIAAVIPPRRIVVGNSELTLSGPLRDNEWFFGIRFSAEGDLIVASRGRLYRISREGFILATFDPHLLTNFACKVDIDQETNDAVVACEFQLMRLDLRTGRFHDAVQISSGAYVESIAVSSVAPARRRTVSH